MSILAIENLRLSRGTREVLRGVTLRAERGELVALMGLSGGGKTTVLRSVAALEPFDAGTIDVDNVVLRPGPLASRATLRELRKRVGMVFQLHYLFDHLTAIQNVMLAPLYVAKAARAETEARAMKLLESLGVAHRRAAQRTRRNAGRADARRADAHRHDAR